MWNVESMDGENSGERTERIGEVIAGGRSCSVMGRSGFLVMAATV